MKTARHPARQLNSKSIRDAILSYVVPEVQKKYCIVSAKVVWRVEKDPNSLLKAWQLICEKREECDNVLKETSNVAFFFSAISSCESKDTFVADTSSSQPSSSSSAIDIAVENGRFPAISYWLALESPNGAPVSLVTIRRKLIECEVEIDTKMLNHVKTNLPQDITKALCTVLKDHNSSYIENITNCSYNFCVKEAFESIGRDETTFLEEFNDSKACEEKVVRFHIPKKAQYWKRLHKVIQALQRSGLMVQLMDIKDDSANEDETSINSRAMTTDPTTQLVNDIERTMIKLGYALYKGVVYKKCTGATYTYTEKCSINEFIGTLEGNEYLKGRLVQYGQKIKDKLKQPDCQLIHQMEVNYDLIEVSDGWCLSLSTKRFLRDAICPEEVGKISPRAFVVYDHDKEPEPKYFKEILENSLKEEEVVRFCNDFLGLLQFQKKKHKEKVPCLIGAADSGKTSLFAPLLSIIPPNNIARVTKQRNFNKAMITKETEVIFIDEAHVKIMDIDDWKLLTQGGWTAHDVKYSTARGFINRCPMLIACQHELNFEEDDQEAMDSRLNRYLFKKLPNKDLSAYEWIKSNPMDCILWAMNKSTVQQNANAQGENTHEGLSKTDQVELFQCSFEEPDDTELIAQESLQIPQTEQSTISEDSDNDNIIQSSPIETACNWKRQLKRAMTSGAQDMNHFRDRLFQTLLTSVEEHLSMKKETQKKIVERQVKSRHARLRDLGISEKEANQVTHPYDPLPPAIQRKVMQEIGVRRKKEEDEKNATMVHKLKQAYGPGTWLRRTELALHENVELMHNKNVNDYTRAGATGMVELLTSKLQSFHKTTRSNKSKEFALKERRRVCIILGILSEDMQHLVRSLTEPLPREEPARFSEMSSQQDLFSDDSTSEEDKEEEDKEEKEKEEEGKETEDNLEKEKEEEDKETEEKEEEDKETEDKEEEDKETENKEEEEKEEEDKEEKEKEEEDKETEDNEEKEKEEEDKETEDKEEEDKEEEDKEEEDKETEDKEEEDKEEEDKEEKEKEFRIHKKRKASKDETGNNKKAKKSFWDYLFTVPK